MQSILLNNINEISNICRKYKVDKLFAFGSVCTNNFSDDSDIDFLVAFQKMDYSDYAEHYFSMVEQLELLLHRPVDLVTVNSLSNPYFVHSVDQTKTLLYGTGN